MNNKLSLGDIQAFLKKQIIQEGDVNAKVEGNDSLDAQVDRLLMSYIANANNVVKEADEKEVDKKNKQEKPEQSKKKSIETIDIRTLCGEIANLIDNVDNLIEFKNTILRRTINTLNKSYDSIVVRQFEIVLEDDFSLAIGKSQKDMEDEIIVPTADRAGPL